MRSDTNTSWGYKSDEKVKDVFAASDYIKVIYKDDKMKGLLDMKLKMVQLK